MKILECVSIHECNAVKIHSVILDIEINFE